MDGIFQDGRPDQKALDATLLMVYTRARTCYSRTDRCLEIGNVVTNVDFHLNSIVIDRNNVPRNSH